MPRVYGVQDDDQKVSGWMSEDDTVSPPTGETAVLESTIRAADPPGAEGRIQSGGKWDGSSYTAPVGDEFYQPYDTSTELGELQAAAVLAHDALVDWEGQADSIGHLKPTDLRATVHDFLVLGASGPCQGLPLYALDSGGSYQGVRRDSKRAGRCYGHLQFL